MSESEKRKRKNGCPVGSEEGKRKTGDFVGGKCALGKGIMHCMTEIE